MKNFISLFIIVFLFTPALMAQQSGNEVMGYHNYYNSNQGQGMKKLYLNDSSFLINANVMINVIADTYVATFGVSESAVNLKEANTKIDERIQKFIAALGSKMNINASEIYVDMTTQTQICDYKVDQNYAEQFISGFEIKKNVIVKVKNIKEVDRMVILASEFGIYDLAKVDYLVTDMNKIYIQLFQTAMESINAKKEMYALATNIKLAKSSQLFGESFYSLFPSQQYKSYTPNITSEYYDYGTYGKRKDLKKNTTFYFDHSSYSGFDKVINPVVTEPTVEFVLQLQIKFDIVK